MCLIAVVISITDVWLRLRMPPVKKDWFSRQPRFAGAEQAMFDVWMTGVLGHAVTREYGRLGPSPFAHPEFQTLLRAAIAAHREGDGDGAERAARAVAAAAVAATGRVEL